MPLDHPQGGSSIFNGNWAFERMDPILSVRLPHGLAYFSERISERKALS